MKIKKMLALAAALLTLQGMTCAPSLADTMTVEKTGYYYCDVQMSVYNVDEGQSFTEHVIVGTWTTTAYGYYITEGFNAYPNAAGSPTDGDFVAYAGASRGGKRAAHTESITRGYEGSNTARLELHFSCPISYTHAIRASKKNDKTQPDAYTYSSTTAVTTQETAVIHFVFLKK